MSWPLPVRGPAYTRADPKTMAALAPVSSATACAQLHKDGITRTFIEGPRPLATGQRIVGSSVTLQFMPQREDIASGVAQEHVERTTALWAVLETVQPGDVLVVQAYGSAYTGCLGDMLVRYFKRRGGAGIIVDGRIRDAPRVRKLGVPIWCPDATPPTSPGMPATMRSGRCSAA
jgi:regulator of RNase E activity RraA